MRVFHIRYGRYARAFAMPDGLHDKFWLLFRGWKPFGINGLWSLPSPNQRRLEREGLITVRGAK